MIHLILCWHFHQPDYRTESGQYFLPWTYLHAIKDYADMASHLEAQPTMRAVINFVPTLLEQLDDYAAQFERGEVRDPVLAGLIDPDLGRLRGPDRQEFIAACFRLNSPTMLEPFAGYRRLQALWQAVSEDEDGPSAEYLSGQFLADLVMWYHLAWTGESLRRREPWLLTMLEKGSDYTLAERRRLFDLIADTLRGLLPRYRALLDRDQIEVSTTPHSHPIAPLLIDFAAARDALPEAVLPATPAYPDGAARVRRHINTAQTVHAEHFGRPAAGCWPAEGGVSSAALGLFSQAGVRWLATGEGVLRNSLKAADLETERPCRWLSRPYRLAGQSTVCFFRDDELSDLIGFTYKGWFAKDAVRHFLHTLEERYRGVLEPNPVVSIVLDGENAWEYYPYNGWYFLSELYEALAEHPHIRSTTFSEYLDLFPDRVAELPQLRAGSWVYGDFSTWIGEPAKNRAWDQLCAAKAAFDAALESGHLAPEQAEAAERLLLSCESSDWFWWFGDYNPRQSVLAFDRLFRAKLQALYQLIGHPPPACLGEPICPGNGLDPGGVESGGTMRRGSL